MTSADDSPVPSYPDLLRMDGRGVVVVGAGQGNGRQSAHALASVGARVLCVDVDETLAREVAAEVGGVACVADARTSEGVDAIVEQAERELGRLDGLVDIVGMARWSPLVDTTDEDWDWVFGMVLRHAFLLARRAGAVMARQGRGAMVFVASVSGLSSAPLHAPYGAAKAGLMSLVRTAAVELGPSGVRANAIAPGSVNTPRIRRQREEAGAPPRAAIEPLGHSAETSDIASAALFPVSDLSRHVTGHTLVVDGGASALFPYADAGQAMMAPRPS